MIWFLLIYAAGYLWCYRYVVGYVLADFSPDRRGLDLELAVMSVLLGTMLTLFWPALVAGRLVQRWYYARDTRSLAFFRAPSPIEPPAVRADRLERERDARDRRIAALEAELGIRQTKARGRP